MASKATPPRLRSTSRINRAHAWEAETEVVEVEAVLCDAVFCALVGVWVM